MKIYTNRPNENWICDRIQSEFVEFNPAISTPFIEKSDLAWIIAPWMFRNYGMLKERKSIFSIYHITPSKFNKGKLLSINNHASAIHTICDKTRDFIKDYVDKPIIVEPFWINQNIWFPLDKSACREELNLPKDSFIIGSFQRDTEGGDLKSPKLEKGPDLLCDYIIDQYSKNNRIKVVLAGWRRQYVINRLQENNIPYVYHEMCDFKTLNELYNTLDLYLVTARHEGGPQAIVECALNKTPIISTDVGIASTILSDNSIFCDTNRPEPNVAYAYNRVLKYTIPSGFFEFEKMFRSILNEGE